MEKKLIQTHDEQSRTKSSSDDSGEEFVISGFTKWRQIRIANASDDYIWVGIEPDHKVSMGGSEFHVDLLQFFGAGFTTSQKDLHRVSRIPWERIQFHRY